MKDREKLQTAVNQFEEAGKRFSKQFLANMEPVHKNLAEASRRFLESEELKKIREAWDKSKGHDTTAV